VGAAGAAGWGVALALGEDTRTVFGGRARPDHDVTDATPFHICSCSKTFTAAVFSRLVQEGQTRWEQPAFEVLPELCFDDPSVTRRCTFRDLASMRVGLSRNGIAEWGIRQDLPKEARLSRLRFMRSEAGFRDRFVYSNLAYIALSLAAERITGRRYADLVRDHLCMPLAMHDTASLGQDAAPEFGEDAALPALPSSGGPVFVRDLTGPNSEGSARIHLSCRDATRWMRFLLDALAGSDTGPLSAASVRAMATPQSAVRDADIRMAPEGDGICAYGMGLFVSRFCDQTLLRHGGGGRGWRHAMALAPGSRAGVMVMASAESPAIEGIALHLLESLLGRASRDWPAAFADASSRAAAIERAGIEAAFPAHPGDMPVAIRPGQYGNPATGSVTITAKGEALHFKPVDAPDFAANIEPLGGETYALRFDEPALAPQPLDPPFRLRVTGSMDSPALETSHFGTLVGAA
jgi:CubicO group peptidase (beta-lactamase class C family)